MMSERLRGVRCEGGIMARGRRWSWGLGPVFAFECVTRARRWRGYAARSAFVTLLLGALALAWGSLDEHVLSMEALQSLGQTFFSQLISIQLVMVLLLGPAATAGAICVEKGRGTLLHVLVTDLADREI